MSRERLTYIGPHRGGVVIGGEFVLPGEEIELDVSTDEGRAYADGLLVQTENWSRSTTKRAAEAKRRAPKRPSEATDAEPAGTADPATSEE